MTLRRLRAGDVLAGLGGLALLGVLFAPWFGGPATTFSAWDTLTVILAFLIVVALLGLAILGLTAFERTPALPVAATVFTTPLGLLAAILVIVRILSPPGSLGLEWGAWAGLACTLLIATGAWWSLRQDVRPYHRSP